MNQPQPNGKFPPPAPQYMLVQVPAPTQDKPVEHKEAPKERPSNAALLAWAIILMGMLWYVCGGWETFQ